MVKEREISVSMRGISKTFGSVKANHNVNLDVYKGEILALLGENGSGKTTLMNMLSGIYFPDEGQIFINGKESEESMERLRVLENSNDGFFIAGEDLKLRGPGDFFGIRQSGDALFELADIYNHADMLQLAQDLLKESGRTMQPVRRNRGGISETVL